MSEEIKINKENKGNKKGLKIFLICTIVLIIVLAIAVAVYIIYKMQNDISYELEEVGQYKYLKLYENEKYGIIDTSGNILIEAQYDQINIPNPSKAVFVCYEESEEQTTTKVLNEKNEPIFTEYEEVLPLMFKELTSEIPFEKSVLKYKQNGKYGVIDFTGKKITDAIYDEISSLQYKEGCLLVTQDEKVGLINIKGKEIIKPEYYSITADGYYNEQTGYKAVGFVVCNRTDEGYRYGYINSHGQKLLEPIYNAMQRVTEIMDDENVYIVAQKNGQSGLIKNTDVILEFQYEDINYNRVNSVFSVRRLAKYGVVDISGNAILPVEYDEVWFVSKNINAKKGEETFLFDVNGRQIEDMKYSTIIETENEEYKITIKDQKYGVINKNEKSIIPNDYQYIEYAFGNLFIATKDSTVGVIDSTAKEKIPFNYSVIQKISGTSILQAINTETKIIDFYDIDLNKVYTIAEATIYQEENYIKILSNSDRKYLNKEGKEVSNKELFEQNNIFASSKNGKWGFVDKDNNVVVEQKYDMVTELNEYGFAGIKLGEKWGVVDKDGKIILEPKYENIDWLEPEFVNKYCKLNFGYGFEYYSEEI